MASHEVPDVVALRLRSNGEPVSNGLLKVPLGCTLRFQIDPGCRDLTTLVLWTNCPVHGKAYERTRFHSVPGGKYEIGSEYWQADILVNVSGAFEFFVQSAAHIGWPCSGAGELCVHLLSLPPRHLMAASYHRPRQ